MPDDISSDVHFAEIVTRVLVEADRASLAVLQSRSPLGGDAAIQTLNSSLDALDALSAAAERIRTELCQRRVQIGRNIHAHNASLPIMRLLPDGMLLVVEALAGLWPPRAEGPEKGLGWITITHVCAVWRRTALSLPSLWADIVGLFASPESFQAILARARDAPLTVGNEWKDEPCDLPEHYWPVFLQSHTLHTIDMWLSFPDTIRLVELLRQRPNTDIEMLSVATSDTRPDDAFTAAVSLPNLRWLAFESIYIPFQAPNLLTLSLEWEGGDVIHIVSMTYTVFLDVLEQCPALTTLEVSGWTPTNPPRLPRKVQLPCLQTLMVIRLDRGARYIDLCQCLDLPALKYVVLDDYPESPLDTLSSVFGWILSDKQMPPCLQGISEVGIDAEERGPFYGANFNFQTFMVEDVTICLDDGSSASAETRGYPTFRGVYHTGPEDRTGVRIQVKKERRGQDTLLDGASLDSVMAGSLKLYGHSTGLSGVRAVHFNFNNNKGVDWHAMLQHPPADIKTLYISCHDFPGVLPALSQTGANGTIVLPRLEAIICTNADDFARRFLAVVDDDKRAGLVADVLSMLEHRAKHGAPVARVTRMEAVCKDPSHGESNQKIVDSFFAELVSLCV